MSIESSPQLPAEMLGVAYENGMGGLSVDLCEEDDDIEEMMDEHMDPEMVCVVPFDSYPMDLIKAAPKMQEVLGHVCFEFEREGKISQVTYELAKRALAKAIGSEWPQCHGTTEYDNMPPMLLKESVQEIPVESLPMLLKVVEQFADEWERGPEWISHDTFDMAVNVLRKARGQ